MKQVYPTFIVNTNDGSEHPFWYAFLIWKFLLKEIPLQMLLKWREMLLD